jgi:hypothetical protein
MRAIGCFALLFLAVTGVGADPFETWQIECGLGDNQYPHGNDQGTRFGVAPGATWDYDACDAAHPCLCDPDNDIGWMYGSKYWELYVQEGIGWPPPWGEDWGVPQYPPPGLLKDMRAPFHADDFGHRELWLVKAYAPVQGYTCSFIWSINFDPAHRVPDDVRFYAILWGNQDLEDVGIHGDLDLLALGDGQHKIPNIPQWGLNEYGTAIRHEWVLEAGIAPEPGMIGAAGLLLGMVAIAGASRRRK